MKNNFVTLYNSFTESINKLHEYINDKDISFFANWIMNTTINPHSYLPEEYADNINNAEWMVSLISTVRHAIIDNGNMTLMIIDGRPSIKFQDSHDIPKLTRLKRYVLRDENNKATIATKEVDCVVQYISTIEEFIIELEKYNRHNLRFSFYSDAYKHSLQFAITNYRNEEFYDPEWELQKPIDDDNYNKLVAIHKKYEKT